MDMHTAITLWREGNDRGDGYAVGDEKHSPSQAAEAEGWTIIEVDAAGRALCDRCDNQLTLICDSHGPWAVDVG